VSKILITGGPVHAFLDDVKIITNRFKGGLMAGLADYLIRNGHDVTWVTSALTKVIPTQPCEVMLHDGIQGYKNLVLDLAPQQDAVILGAAVANLIPVKQIEGKFPSHDYKPGDIIPIDFTIAPRIIDMVHKVAPKTHLFGFKLLSHVDKEELIRAAYGVLLDSKATAIFANDAADYSDIHMVMKDRSVHPMSRDSIAKAIEQLVADQYYQTIIKHPTNIDSAQITTFFDLVQKFENRWKKIPEGFIFGTVAVRANKGFYTTTRGKNELDDWSYVETVSHFNRKVYASKKASLNAPLLDWIFMRNPKVNIILHFHEQDPNLVIFSYAPPGTVRDSQRNTGASFNIEGHGCFYLLENMEETSEIPNRR